MYFSNVIDFKRFLSEDFKKYVVRDVYKRNGSGNDSKPAMLPWNTLATTTTVQSSAASAAAITTAVIIAKAKNKN